MPNGQAQQQGEVPTSPTAEKAWIIFWNFVKRGLGRRRPTREEAIPGQPAPILPYLPLEINTRLITLLTDIEAKWKAMDKFLWDDPKILIKLYEELGFYDDISVVELEYHTVQTGSPFRFDDATQEFHLDPVDITWPDGNKEQLYFFGPANIQHILGLWEEKRKRFEKILVDDRVDANTRGILSNIRNKLLDLINERIKEEDEYVKSLDKKRGLFKSYRTYRGAFLDLIEPYHKYIRFKHTYKVIKTFYWDEANNRPVYFDSLKNRLLYNDRTVSHEPSAALPTSGGFYKYTSFIPWPWEQFTGIESEEVTGITGRRVRARFMTGLDENGYPLEIDNNGVVLLDKWWYEIGHNVWQMGVISQKDGGAEIIKRINHIKQHGIRVVDKKFATDQAYLDLLEMAVYIYVEVDSVRDDLRDGRYHKHSKTTTDYIIHAEGGLEINPNRFTTVREILKEPIRLEFNQFGDQFDNPFGPGGYINAYPDFFNGRDILTGRISEGLVPKEELEVTRNYRIKEYKRDPVTGAESFGYEQDTQGKPIFKERKPTNISPAFDRRALNRAAPLIHWGRMYYYEDIEGINKWSENPYPHISTRGVAKYMMYWLATKAFNFSQATDAADQIGQWDIGIRRPLVGGPFVKNPFTDIISIGK